MRESIIASGSELVTVALKRIDVNDKHDEMLSHLQIDGVGILPNTSGAGRQKKQFLQHCSREKPWKRTG